MKILRMQWWMGAVGIIGVLALPANATAQDKVGTTGLQFLEIGVSPRADAMGGAFTAISDDASAVYYNPAGLVQLEGRQVMISGIDYPAGIFYGFVGAGIPMRFGGVLGIGYYGLNAGTMPRTDYKYPYGDGTTFGAGGYTVSASYGRYLTDRFSVGVTFKVISEFLEDNRATAWAADVGTNYNTGFRNFKITMMISNFGPNTKHIAEDIPLPISFRFGGAVDVWDSPKHHATLAVEGSHPSDNRERYNAGIEYTFNNMASFRIGDRIEQDLGTVSVGGGLRFSLSEKTKAHFDYSYQDFGALNNVQRFAVTLDF